MPLCWSQKDQQIIIRALCRLEISQLGCRAAGRRAATKMHSGGEDAGNSEALAPRCAERPGAAMGHLLEIHQRDDLKGAVARPRWRGWRRKAPTMTFSRTVMSSKVAGTWKVRPMPANAWVRAKPGSGPSRQRRPCRPSARLAPVACPLDTVVARAFQGRANAAVPCSSVGIASPQRMAHAWMRARAHAAACVGVIALDCLAANVPLGSTNCP
jgi:hypothetical protein